MEGQGTDPKAGWAAEAAGWPKSEPVGAGAVAKL